MNNYVEDAKTHENDQLANLSTSKNSEIKDNVEHKLFINLSLSEIMSNMSTTIIVIINELQTDKKTNTILY